MLSLCVNRAVGFSLKGNFCRELASDGFCGADFGGTAGSGYWKVHFCLTNLFIYSCSTVSSTFYFIIIVLIYFVYCTHIVYFLYSRTCYLAHTCL